VEDHHQAGGSEATAFSNLSLDNGQGLKSSRPSPLSHNLLFLKMKSSKATHSSESHKRVRYTLEFPQPASRSPFHFPPGPSSPQCLLALTAVARISYTPTAPATASVARLPAQKAQVPFGFDSPRPPTYPAVRSLRAADRPRALHKRLDFLGRDLSNCADLSRGLGRGFFVTLLERAIVELLFPLQ
jgi:hypothetical protein